MFNEYILWFILNAPEGRRRAIRKAVNILTNAGIERQKALEIVVEAAYNRYGSIMYDSRPTIARAK